MRILFISSTFEPLTGGAETYGLLLTGALADAGHHVTVVTDGSWLPSLPIDSQERGCRVIRLRSFAEEVNRRDKVVWRQLQHALLHEIGSVLGDEKFDVVHANSHETLQLALPIAESIDAALVASLHEQNPDSEPFGVGRCRLAYKRLPVDMHIVASDFYERRARLYGTPASKLRRIYHGVGSSNRLPERDDARRRLGVPKDALVITCAARLYTRKGQVDLAKSFEIIRANYPQAHLLLAGRVSDFDYASRVFRLLDSSVKVGAVTHHEDLTLADMPDVFAASDIVVQPSLEEGLGLAAIEAMQNGIPVVVSDVVGLNEVVRDGIDGLVVPKEDPGALADAVQRLIENPELRRTLVRGGRQTVADRFSIEAMLQSTIMAYAAAIRNHHDR